MVMTAMVELFNGRFGTLMYNGKSCQLLSFRQTTESIRSFFKILAVVL